MRPLEIEPNFILRFYPADATHAHHTPTGIPVKMPNALPPADAGNAWRMALLTSLCAYNCWSQANFFPHIYMVLARMKNQKNVPNGDHSTPYIPLDGELFAVWPTREQHHPSVIPVQHLPLPILK